MRKNIKVTVLLSIYNGETFLTEAINSILNQNFVNFEFLIINDKSTDKTSEIIRTFSDKRIRVIHNKKNLGLAASLNKGIKLAKGEYIIRMDADDISLPNRIEKLIDFLDKNPEVKIVGSWIKTFGAREEIWKHPSASNLIKAKLLFNSALVHPAVCIRKSFFQKQQLSYDSIFTICQDYDLWTKLDNFKLANIPEVLLLYRTYHPNSRKKYWQTQTKESNIIKRKQLKKIGINPTKKEFDLHTNLGSFNNQLNESDLLEIKEWFKKLVQHNKKSNYYDQESLTIILGEKWLAAFLLIKNKTTISWKIFLSSNWILFSMKYMIKSKLKQL